MPELKSVVLATYRTGSEGNITLEYSNGTRKIRVDLFSDEVDELLKQVEQTQEFKGIVSRVHGVINRG